MPNYEAAQKRAMLRKRKRLRTKAAPRATSTPNINIRINVNGAPQGAVRRTTWRPSP